ncbi:MAG: DUF5615 family PIN-like protein [Blastocatellia bacterium]
MSDDKLPGRLLFQADNDLNARIIESVQRSAVSIDFRTAPEAGFHQGTSDSEVLRYCAAHERILISHDLRTMPWEFAAHVATEHSPGIVIFQQDHPIRSAAAWIHYFWEAGQATEFANRCLIINDVF